VTTSELTAKDRKWLRFAGSGANTFSTCSKAQYMAIIIGTDGTLIGTGYNGGARGMKHCADGGCPRAINKVPSGTPYDFGDGLCIAIHAEANALLYSDFSRRSGATMYVNGIPCVSCSRLISNSGIKRVVCLDREQLGTDEVKWLLDGAGVELVVATLLDIGI
jgi:dCMP deaminase